MKRAILVLAAFLAIQTSGCIVVFEEDDEKSRDVESRSTNLEPGYTLIIEGYNGAIAVTGVNNGRTASFRFEKTARGRDEQEARSYLEEISIVESTNRDDRTHTVRIRSDRAEKTSVEVRAEIPSDTPLILKTDNGSITVEGITATLAVDINNGTVEVTGATSHVTARSRNGSIEVGMADFPPENEIELGTNNGSVRLRIPRVASAVVSAKTNVGSIETHRLDFVEKTLDRTLTGATLDARLGSGRGTIDLRTNNGSIDLEGW
jgi:hypothetical protein